MTNRIVDEVQSYISQHYAERLTLTDIANQFYISPYYLRPPVQKTTNLSLVEYINGVRVKAAQSLIERTKRQRRDGGRARRVHDRRAFPPCL